MRRTKLLLIGVLAAIPIVIGGVGVAQAQSFRSGDTTTVAADETVDSTLFAAGKTVDIAGTVNGDVFCAGQNVTVSGTVNGDVICAGQTVRVSGTVNGDVRAAGQTVTVSAAIEDNLTAAGQNVTIEAGARVGGDASLAGTDVILNGEVGRDVVAGSNAAVMNGRVGRNIQGEMDRLTLGGSASVGGNISYSSRNELTRQPGSEVNGTVTRDEPRQATGRGDFRLGWWFLLWLFVSMLVLAMLLVLLFPRAFHATTDSVLRRPGWVLLTGVAASLIAPVVIVGLLFTMVGIPVALLALFAWMVVALLAGPVAAYLLGRLLLRGRTDNAIWIMLLGAAVLLLVYLIPVLGLFVALIAYWVGLGAILWQVGCLPKLQYHMAAPAGPAAPGDAPAKTARKQG